VFFKVSVVRLMHTMGEVGANSRFLTDELKVFECKQQVGDVLVRHIWCEHGVSVFQHVDEECLSELGVRDRGVGSIDVQSGAEA
jgi:hypothetical protein